MNELENNTETKELTSEEKLGVYKQIETLVEQLPISQGNSLILIWASPGEEPDVTNLKALLRGDTDIMAQSLLNSMCSDPKFSPIVIKACQLYMIKKLGEGM